VLSTDPAREAAIRSTYRDSLVVARDITILSRSGREPVLKPERTTLDGIDAWIAMMADLGGSTEHYLAFADEPNLNYPDFESFRRYFVAAAPRARAHPRAKEAKIRIAAPASSRFTDGPTRDNAVSRKGIEWTRRLLDEHPDLIDAVSWHWWQVRDLV